MKNSKKLILVMISIICIVILLVGSIAYYRIVVSGSITGSTGNAVFVLRDTEDGESWNNKVINLGQINPGDSGSFDVVMDASGSSVDMYATLSIDRGVGDTELPTNLKFYTTSDHKSELHKYYSFLEKSGTNKETLTIYWYWNPYIDDIEDTKYMNKSFSASINVNAVQISEYAMMKNSSNVSIDSNNKPTFNGTEFWTEENRNRIRIINFGNDLSNLPSECTAENLCWDVSNDGSNQKVYAYMIDSGIEGVIDIEDNTENAVKGNLYNLYIVSSAPIFAPSDCSYMFYSFPNLIKINFNNNFNTSLVTNMNSMFRAYGFLYEGSGSYIQSYEYNEAKIELLSNSESVRPTLMSTENYEQTFLKELDLSSFNTNNVTNMERMFSGCSSLTSLDLSSFNTSNVTDMSYMFIICSSLISLDLSSLNTSNVTDMSYMFVQCEVLTSLDLSSFNTSNVTDMSYMFLNCSSLISLDLSSFNTSNVTDMSSMFSNCSSLTSLDLSNFNTSNVTDMSYMFYLSSSLTSLKLSSFNTSNVTDMSYMFAQCEVLTSLDLSNFNTSNVTDMSYMFERCSSLTSLDLSGFNTSKVTNMDYMFLWCSSLTTTINIMNVSVTNYSGIFLRAATASGSKITVNYIADASALVDKMIATKSSNSNVVKGIQI